jgi:hypothetical membrane protein
MATVDADIDSRCAWSGLAAPVIFVGVFTIEGALRPDYSAVSSYVSALSLGPRGWVQIASFLATGALLLAFGRCGELRHATVWGARLLGVIGVGILLSGPFVMDPTGTPPRAMSLHGIVHQILGAIVFALMPITCFAARSSRNRFRAWSILAGATITAAIFALKVAQLGSPVLAPMLGLIQRVALVTFFTWVFSLAWALRSRADQSSG